MDLYNGKHECMIYCFNDKRVIIYYIFESNEAWNKFLSLQIGNQ